jgi:KipI family sensor histidine kinase inhibitor
MIRAAGEHSLLIDVPAGVRAADLAAALRTAWREELTDAVPGHETLLASWKGAPPTTDAVLAAIANSTQDAGVPTEPAEVLIPVVYDGPDLEAVAAAAGMSTDAVIAIHTSTDYEAAFTGFLPGFAYLVSANNSLHVPRHQDPRPRVPAGSVALGGEYCAVYPRASPGGWQLIGYTTASLFDPARDRPALIEPGSHVRFEAVRA